MIYLLLLLLTLGLYSASNKVNQYIFKENENVIINTFIFSFFFGLIYLINSYLFILNINNKYFSYLFFAIIIIISSFQTKEIYNYFKIFNLNYISNNKIILTILLFYFFTILMPIADEDSLRYHLEIGKKINDGTFYLNTWFDYVYMGAHEFINSFALRLNFEHIASYSNFLYLLFAILSNSYILKKYKEGSGIFSGIILLSCPYLVALISSQKFYFFPCFIVSYSIAYLYLEKKINALTIHLILFLNIFCVIIKPIFFPYLILVGIWLLIIINGYKNKIYYLFSGLVFVVILYFPIFLIKQKIYNDPFLPYISINNENSEWLSDFYFHMFVNMDFTDTINNLYIKYFLIPIKLIVPLQISDLFKTLGVGLLFIFSFNYKKNKYLFVLLLFFILAVVALNNFGSRWFLPLLIFISIFAKIDRINFLKKITYLQLLAISCFIIPIGLSILASNMGIIDKKIILNKLVSSVEIIEKINKKHNNPNIFSDLNNQYYFDNVVPIYYPNITKKFDPNYFKKNENKTKLILWSNKYGNIDDFVKNNFNCKKYKKIEEFDFNPRRFFILTAKMKSSLYKLNC